MLEVLVFSKRIMERTRDGSNPKAAEKKKNADEYHSLPERKSRKKMPEISVSNLKNLMWDKVGIIRNQEGLTAAANTLAAWQRGLPLTERVSWELSNMILTGNLMAEAALIRQESRGAQFRTDFPETSDAWKHHIVFYKQITSIVSAAAAFLSKNPVRINTYFIGIFLQLTPYITDVELWQFKFKPLFLAVAILNQCEIRPVCLPCNKLRSELEYYG